MASTCMLAVAALLLDDGKSDAFVDMVMAAHGWTGVTADTARAWKIAHGYDCTCPCCKPWRHSRPETAARPVQLNLF